MDQLNPDTFFPSNLKSEKERRAYLLTFEGHQDIANSMLSLLTKTVDKESFTRKIFDTTTGDVSTETYPESQTIRIVLTFDSLTRDNTINVTEYLENLFDMARFDLQSQEDTHTVKLLDVAADQSKQVKTVQGWKSESLAAGRFLVERNRLVAEKLLVNRQNLTDILTAKSAKMETDRTLLLAGYWGDYLGGQIITAAGTGVEEVVPADSAYWTATPNYWSSMVFDKPLSVRIIENGFEFSEEYRQVVTDPRGVAKISVN